MRHKFVVASMNMYNPQYEDVWNALNNNENKHPYERGV